MNPEWLLDLESWMRYSFDWVAYGTLALAPLVFLVLLFVQAPYGRHVRPGWGPMLNNRMGWFLMELPAVLVFGFIMIIFADFNRVPVVLLVMWQLHYCHRVFVYPLTLKKGGQMPWMILIMAVVFNTTNGYLNAWSIASQPQKYIDAWLTSPQFLLGVTLFFAGMALNKHSDKILADLAVIRNRTGEYQLPCGGFYRWISCPNYLGEIVQWTGWAVASWSLAGWVFAVWTMANLVPRAISHHRWYRQSFEDYPSKRRALIPYLL